MLPDNYTPDDIEIGDIRVKSIAQDGVTFVADVLCLWKSGTAESWMAWSLLEDEAFDSLGHLVCMFKQSVLDDIEKNPSMWPEKRNVQ